MRRLFDSTTEFLVKERMVLKAWLVKCNVVNSGHSHI